MTNVTEGLYLTRDLWHTMLEIINQDVEMSGFDIPDYKDEDLMQYYKDRAVLYNTIKELLS